jgi:uncharacterized protein YceH (UPF0502 family)
MDEKEFKRLLDASAEETRRHFDVTVERLESRFELLTETVSHLDQKIDGIDLKMDRGFAETQAVIKFSHAELDRRVRTLEEGMADLQARVERLEQSTH